MKLHNISEDRYDELPDEDQFESDQHAITFTVPMRSTLDVVFSYNYEECTIMAGNMSEYYDIDEMLSSFNSDQQCEFISSFINTSASIMERHGVAILLKMAFSACQKLDKSVAWAGDYNPGAIAYNEELPLYKSLPKLSSLGELYGADRHDWPNAVATLMIDYYNQGYHDFFNDFYYLASIYAE